MSRPPLSQLVESLPATVPFVGPEAMERERGRPFRARLGANESSFGPSPLAIRAMVEAAAENWKYSDPENYELRESIAAHHGVKLSEVVVGEGIDGLLGLAVKMAADPGSTIVTSDGAYPTFNFHVAAHGAHLIKVPFRDDHEDLERLLETATSQNAAALYISNPNNPMGTWWRAAELNRLIEQLPPKLSLFLDEAYCETAPQDAVPGIDTTNPQVFRFRTFSKAYGLAGARIGYVIGEHQTVAAFDRIRNHYGINRVGQIGAKAALLDQLYLEEVIEKISAARSKISEIATSNGLTALPSAANFVTIDCGVDGEFASSVLKELLAQDVFVRKPSVAPLDRCIRVSCGIEKELAIFAEALPHALAAARSQIKRP